MFPFTYFVVIFMILMRFSTFKNIFIYSPLSYRYIYHFTTNDLLYFFINVSCTSKDYIDFHILCIRESLLFIRQQ